LASPFSAPFFSAYLSSDPYLICTRHPSGSRSIYELLKEGVSVFTKIPGHFYDGREIVPTPYDPLKIDVLNTPKSLFIFTWDFSKNGNTRIPFDP